MTRQFGPTSMDLLTLREVLIVRHLDGQRSIAEASLAARRQALELIGETFTDPQFRADVRELKEAGALREVRRNGSRLRTIVYTLTDGGVRALQMTQRRLRLISDLASLETA